MSKIDLCVVTHNSLTDLQFLVSTLESDIEEFGQYWNLYIADNGSTDGTVGWLKSIDKPHIKAVDYNENVGYSAACNKLATYGDSEFLALCNADIWLTGSDVKGILDTYAETNADIVGPKQRNRQGKITHGGIFGSNTRPQFRGWQVYDPDDKLFRDRRDAITVSGSAYFVRRSVWDALTNDPEYRKMVPDAVGAFLPTFFYYEETFSSYFSRHRGYKLIYDGTVSIGHDWHASHPQGDYLDTVEVHKSRAMFRSACDFLGIERD